MSALASTVGVAAGEPARPLRIVTLNLLHGGPWEAWTGERSSLEQRFEMVVQALRALDPDVVGLQEVSRTRRYGNLAERLGRALGLNVATASATERVLGPRLLGRPVVWLLGFEEGPAVLARFPIVGRAVHGLPRCQRWLDPRVLLRADVDTPAGRLAVYSTHLSRDDCQVGHVGELVARERGALGAIVTGDFNTADSSPALTRLREAFGFVDAFRVANPEAPGHTVWQRPGAPEPTVFRRVDYIFVVPTTPGRLRVRRSRVIFDTPARRPDGTTLWPSDHYGVLAEVELFEGSRTAGVEWADKPTSMRQAF